VSICKSGRRDVQSGTCTSELSAGELCAYQFVDLATFLSEPNWPSEFIRNRRCRRRTVTDKGTAIIGCTDDRARRNASTKEHHAVNTRPMIAFPPRSALLIFGLRPCSVRHSTRVSSNIPRSSRSAISVLTARSNPRRSSSFKRAALGYDARPDYHKPTAKKCRKAGMDVLVCTPERLAECMAEIIRG